jgi:hypothetical protein
MFEPITGQMAFKGSVRSRSGQILSGREVIITGNGQTYRTFTNQKGEYGIPEWIIGPVTVKVGSTEKSVLQPGSKVDIELP